ncbi:MAG: MlaD family protein [Armatimonadota bacterium]
MGMTNEVRVGIMTLIGLVLLVLLIMSLTRWGQDRNTYAFTILFRQAQGLQSGADVRVAGVTVGYVESVGLDRATNLAAVTVRVNRSVRIREGYQFTVGMGGIVGEHFIEITPTETKSALLKDGDRVTGTETPDINSVVANASSLIDELKITTKSVNSIVGSKENQRKITQALDNIVVTSKNAAEMSAVLNRLMVHNQVSIDRIVANLTDVSNDARKVSSLLTVQLTKSESIHNLDIATANAVRISERLESIARSIDALLSDEELSRGLKESVGHMKQASVDLELLLVEARQAAAGVPTILTNLQKASANVEKASADLPEITKPFREIAPETAANIKQVSVNIRNVSQEVGGIAQQVKRIGQTLQNLRIQPEIREMVLAQGSDKTRLDLNLDIKGESQMLRAGLTNIGKDNDWNLQLGSRMGNNTWLRYGVVQSNFGAGIDYQLNPDLRFSADIFDPDSVRANALLDYRLKPLGTDWWLSAGWYDIFSRGKLGVGITFRP